MKIILFGHNGWIGKMILTELRKKYPQHILVLSNTRVTQENYHILENELSDVDRVICTIGRTSGDNIPNIDYLEEHLFENLRDNLYAPLLLANICKSNNIHMTYMGTGCIFNTNTRIESKKFTEDDVPNFFGSSYSVVKGVTDNLMKTYPNVLNLRIRMPITNYEHNKDFISKILKFNKVCSYPNSMTYLPSIVPCIVDMSIKKINGTFNMTNKGSISHEEIISQYKSSINPNHKCEFIEQDELSNILKSKRSNNILDQSKLQSLYPDLPDINTCINEALSHHTNL